MLAVLLFVIGVILGRLYFGVILLPIIYGIPRAAWEVVRGRVRAFAVLIYVFPVVLWSVLFFAVVLAFRFVVPSSAIALFGSSASATGQLLGIFYGFLQMASTQGRRDLNLDFSDAIARFRRV